MRSHSDEPQLGVLAGSLPDARDHVVEAREAVARMRPGTHFEIAQDRRNIALTDAGYDLVEGALRCDNICSAGNLPLLIAIHLALQARFWRRPCGSCPGAAPRS
ncbi:MAG: hypothetical protein HYY16_04880 [Planctomycetes bacterium]|nr:hypothetical protein [Planctomycetota bacterium]